MPKDVITTEAMALITVTMQEGLLLQDLFLAPAIHLPDQAYQEMFTIETVLRPELLALLLLEEVRPDMGRIWTGIVMGSVVSDVRIFLFISAETKMLHSNRLIDEI